MQPTMIKMISNKIGIVLFITFIGYTSYVQIWLLIGSVFITIFHWSMV